MNCKHCGKDCDPGVKCWNCETFNEAEKITAEKIKKAAEANNIGPFKVAPLNTKPEPRPLPTPGPCRLIDQHNNLFDIDVRDIRFDSLCHGAKIEAIFSKEKMHDLRKIGDVQTVGELDVDIQGLRITGKWPAIRILVQDMAGEWIELDKIYKLNLILDASNRHELPKVQIERYVGLSDNPRFRKR